MSVLGYSVNLFWVGVVLIGLAVFYISAVLESIAQRVWLVVEELRELNTKLEEVKGDLPGTLESQLPWGLLDDLKDAISGPAQHAREDEAIKRNDWTGR